MPAAEAAQAHYAQRQVLVEAAASVAASRWAQVDTSAIAMSWRTQLPVVAGGLTGAQLAAAQSADTYVSGSMVAEGLAVAADGTLVAASLAGVAADGRDLVSLLYQPVITALTAIQGGDTLPRAMAAGLSQLDTMVRTEVADAGRTADEIAMTTHGTAGYVRLVVGATCNRCIILAGRWYRWSDGFERHPKCDCVMVPAGEDDEPLTSPEATYEAMTRDERTAAGWSRDEQEAIALGADIAAVTNIHRKGSLYVAGGRQFARESTTKRGSSPGARITPRQIMKDANGDRDETLRLLRRFGYIK